MVLGGGDDFGAAVVAVLTHLGDHAARAAAFGSLELFDAIGDVLHVAKAARILSHAICHSF